MSDLRIVLLGKTGSGKSSTGNTILGRDVFEVSRFPVSTTEKCEKYEKKVEGRNISVIDTPGLFHTSMTEKHLKAELEKTLQMYGPGPHVFLLVIRLGRFTDEEKNTVKWFQKNFGEEAKRFTILLFTGADQLNKQIEEFLQENQDLIKIVDDYEGRYYAFNNTEKDGAQVDELLKKIKAMMKRNREGFYTIEMFKKTLRVKRRIQIICAAVTLICSGYGLYRLYRAFWCDFIRSSQ